MPIVDGVQTPGTLGQATHLGEPLTCDQIRELTDGCEVVITWSGGNGPHPYRVLVDTDGERRAEGLHNDRILSFVGWPSIGRQRVPLHRVTIGWDDQARAFAESKPAYPDHVREYQEVLRGIAQPRWNTTQIRVAQALNDVLSRLNNLVCNTDPSWSVVIREELFAAINAAARNAFGSDTVRERYPGAPTVRWAAMMAYFTLDGVSDEDKAVAQSLINVDFWMGRVPYTNLGGVPVVEQRLIVQPVESAAESALGFYWRRALRRAQIGQS